MYNQYQIYDSPALYFQIIVYKHAWLSFQFKSEKYLVNRHVYDPHSQHLCCFVERCVSRHCAQDFGVLVPTLKNYFILSVTVRLGRELPLSFMKYLKGQCHEMNSLQKIYVFSIHNTLNVLFSMWECNFRR
jgi:hypothetical protein